MMKTNPLAVEVTSCHQRAMVFAQDAYAARMQGRLKIAARLTRKAYDLEKKAADLVAPLLDVEPTRSILHRSAATLALECQEIREAEKLVAAGLAGDPPEEIAEELRDLLENCTARNMTRPQRQTLILSLLYPDEAADGRAGSTVAARSLIGQGLLAPMLDGSGWKLTEQGAHVAHGLLVRGMETAAFYETRALPEDARKARLAAKVEEIRRALGD